MPDNFPQHRHPILRWLGHTLGLLYILVTLLFGPIKWLAKWLRQRKPVQYYRRFVGSLPPPLALAAAILSLLSLELSKLAVLITYEKCGLAAALLAAVFAKASFGFFAHTTWHAARHKVITTYPWAARLDTWVSRTLTQLKTFRAQLIAYIQSSFWWPDAVDGWDWLRRRSAPWIGAVRQKFRGPDDSAP